MKHDVTEELARRLKSYNTPEKREWYLKAWDEIRASIAAGNKASWPRDCFESWVEGWIEDADEAAALLRKLSDSIFFLSHSKESYRELADAMADKVIEAREEIRKLEDRISQTLDFYDSDLGSRDAASIMASILRGKL